VRRKPISKKLQANHDRSLRCQGAKTWRQCRIARGVSTHWQPLVVPWS